MLENVRLSISIKKKKKKKADKPADKVYVNYKVRSKRLGTNFFNT